MRVLATERICVTCGVTFKIRPHTRRLEECRVCREYRRRYDAARSEARGFTRRDGQFCNR